MSWLDDGADDDDLEFDESSVRVRPNPKANRPRTKRRPAHADAQIARVLGVDRGRYTVLVDEDGPEERRVLATRARELRKQPIVNGDRARVVGDTTGDDGTLSRIIGIEERSSLLRRSADDTDQVERIVVANADQMLVVVAAADPEPRARLVDQELKKAQSQNRRILIYPEGHLSPVGQQHRYRKGVFHMYDAYGCAAVPVATNLGLRWPEEDN